MALERIDSLPVLKPRVEDGHKGLYGTVLVIAGGRGMAGAAALCGASALRSGAGLVRVATPAEVQPTVASFEPCYMTYPLPHDPDGLVRLEPSIPVLERLIASADVVAIGPGLGQSDDIRGLIRWVIKSTEKPLVIDADGLNALAVQPEILSGLTRAVVVTPHPGEFARLTATDVAAVQADRIGNAARFAASSEQLIVVLKGAGTVVTDGHRVYVNRTGNPGMATGGAGDVLTGVIAALIGQRLPAFDAAQLGVYIHGLAGDIARDQGGTVGMIAGDIVDSLPDAFDHATMELEPEAGL
ncbi:MAG: NAD(P)H-hydrate dehydratase [Isosphaeraceae bacterium]